MYRGRRRPARTSTTPWQRRRRRAIAALMLLAVLVSPVFIWRLRMRAEVNQRFADLHRQGLPTTLAELAAWETHDPQEADADAAYNKVLQHYREMDMEIFSDLPKFEPRNPLLLERPFSETTRRALEARLKGNEATLEDLLAASRYPRYRIAPRYENGPEESFPNLERAFEILAAHACLLAEDGDGDAALDNIVAGVRIARACRASPFSVAFNKSAVFEFRALSVLPAVVVRAAVSPDKLKALEVLISNDDWKSDVQRTIIGDRCVELFRNTRFFPRSAIAGALTGFRDRRLLDIFHYFNYAPELAQMPYEDRRVYMDQHPVAIMYNWTVIPPSASFDPVPIAILRYLREKGGLPQTLDALVPEYLEAESEETAVAKGYALDPAGFRFDGVTWPVLGPLESGGSS